MPFQPLRFSGSANGNHILPATTAPDNGPSWHYLVGQFSEALGLTPKPLAAIQPAFDNAETQFALLRLEATEKARQVLDETLTEMRPLLSQQQREVLDLCKRIEQALQRASTELDQRKHSSHSSLASE